MPNGRIKKYKVEYVIENTTGNMYALDVNLDKSNWKISLKSKLYRTNSFDPTEKLDWKRITDVLMGDPIIRGICDSICDGTGNPKRIDIISYKGKKFRTKHWFVSVDNSTITAIINKTSTIRRDEINLRSFPDEFTTQSINSFGLEVDIKMKSNLTDFIYLLKKANI